MTLTVLLVWTRACVLQEPGLNPNVGTHAWLKAVAAIQ